VNIAEISINLALPVLFTHDIQSKMSKN